MSAAHTPADGTLLDPAVQQELIRQSEADRGYLTHRYRERPIHTEEHPR